MIPQAAFGEVKALLGNPTASLTIEPDKWTYGARSVYEVYCLRNPPPVIFGKAC